jgi:4-hydroxy-2-oxoheptanedioate aldolase
MEKFVEQKANPTELSLLDYYREANDSIVVMVQIETATALEQIDQIAAVPGVDVCFIGPVDLGNLIGHPAKAVGEYAPELHAAIDRVHEATQKAGKWTAIFTGSGANAQEYAAKGFNMINAMTDVGAIRKSFGEALAEASK